MNGLQTEELTLLKEELEEVRKQNVLLQTQLGDKDALVNTLVSKLSNLTSEADQAYSEYDRSGR